MKNLQIVHSFSQYSSRIIKVSESLFDKCNFNITVLPAAQGEINMGNHYSDGLTVSRIILRTNRLPKSSITQMLKYLEFAYKAIRLSLNENFDIITVRKYTFLPIGFITAKILNVPLIYDIHELESLQAGQSWKQRLVAKLFELLFIKHCSAVIVVSPSIADWYKKTYSLKHVSTVMNCPRFEDILGEKKSNQKRLRQEFGLKETTKILIYVGGLFEERNLPGIIKLMELPKMRNLALIFMGYGPFASEIKQHSLYNKNIFLKNAVAQNEVVSTISGADISIMLPVKGDSLSHEYSLPNKFFQSIMANVPFISTNLPTIAALIEKHEIGYTVSKHDDYNALQDYIFQLAADEDKNNENLKKASHIFNWENQEQILIEAYMNSIK